MSDFEEKLDTIAGILAPLALVYIFVIMGVHFTRKYEGTDKIILRFSKFSLAMVIFSLICVLLTYYAPHLGSNSCQCQLLWRIALVTFITGLYSVKFMYVTRVYVYFRGPSTDGLFTGKVPYSVFLLFISMTVCFVAIIALQFVTLSGDCHLDVAKFGCVNRFHNSNVWVAFCMIVIDITLFSWYSRHWNSKIRDIISHSPASLAKQNKKLLHAFKIQLFLTSLALATTAVDGILHIIIKRYWAISLFVLDNVMVATANALGFTDLRIFLYYRVLKCKKVKDGKDMDSTEESGVSGREAVPSKTGSSGSSSSKKVASSTPVDNGDGSSTKTAVEIVQTK